jgi:hypothetical protein
MSKFNAEVGSAFISLNIGIQVAVTVLPACVLNRTGGLVIRVEIYSFRVSQ